MKRLNPFMRLHSSVAECFSRLFIKSGGVGLLGITKFGLLDSGWSTILLLPPPPPHALMVKEKNTNDQGNEEFLVIHGVFLLWWCPEKYAVQTCL